MAISPAVMTTWVMGAEKMYGPMIVSSLPSDQFVYPSSIHTHTHMPSHSIDIMYFPAPNLHNPPFTVLY